MTIYSASPVELITVKADHVYGGFVWVINDLWIIKLRSVYDLIINVHIKDSREFVKDNFTRN